MKRLRAIIVLIVVLGVVALVVMAGILPRLKQQQSLRRFTELSAEPAITITHPKIGNPAEEVVLPGNIQAFIDAPIYARTSGYLKAWYFDIGTHVKKDQLLAVIESPEVDQQLQQAREDLNTAQANLKLAQITASRYTDLFKTDSVAKQDVDNAVQDAAAKSATVKSAQANVARLEQMVDFEKVYMPFDGVVTARNTDIGQLIQAGAQSGTGSTTGAAKDLFHVAAIDRLRVFVEVPQEYSHVARPGIEADLTLPELPGRRFPGKLVRTTDTLDSATRTLTVEIDVVNSTGLLYPGAYVQAHFKVKGDQVTLIVPGSSLLFRTEGLRLPTVVNGNRIKLAPVILGRDFGDTVEVLTGISKDALIVENPPDSLVDGELIRVVPKRSAPKAEE
ncbi:MAG TPA: efflux RND transporter periplasmic adaptor subunit [Bryobacteraceae bacterium]|jgi:RND family efflux transporter MFP subunit|nr:efflux RND transporter periplasmic adaptor subunit [Bryobacteraceae bacterium]